MEGATLDLWPLIADVVMLLGVSLLFGGLFSRFGQSPLLGYLLAGMLLGGPANLPAIGSKEEIHTISELGVTLLLFTIGLEFSLKRLKKLGIKPLIGGAIQVVSTTVLAATCAYLFGTEFKESLAFGAMISLSSTAVVLRMLMERSELDMPHGRNSLAVLLTQDMAVVPLALLMTLLAGQEGTSGLAVQVGRLLSAFGVLLLGLYLLNKIAELALGTLTLHRNRELAIIFAVVTGMGSAWAAHYMGISPALGAFIAGMFLGTSPFATQIRADISSLRVVLLTLFFSSVGMITNPIWIAQNWYTVGAVVAIITLGKMGIIWVIFQMLGHTTRVASATAFCLAQVGEFAFVLGNIGVVGGVVSSEMYTLVVSVTIVSFFLSAFLVPNAARFGNYLAALLGDDARRLAEDHTTEPPDVVIIGFGPTGRTAAQPFVDKDKRIVVIELNRNRIRAAQKLGFRGEIGDATQSDVLEHVNIRRAKTVVITVPDYRSALTILEQIRQQAPHIYVVVRSRYIIHSDDFIQAGAHCVVGDEEQVGENIANHLRTWLDSLEEGMTQDVKD